MDVLKATLAAGVLVRKYVPSYGDLPNDAPTVTKCKSCNLISVTLHIHDLSFSDFRERFKIIHVSAGCD
jgi:hypothetical protein